MTSDIPKPHQVVRATYDRNADERTVPAFKINIEDSTATSQQF